LHGEALVLDLTSDGGRLLPADRLDKASKEIRRSCSPRSTRRRRISAAQSGPLTKLAGVGKRRCASS
jgi:hypothetical protein